VEVVARSVQGDGARAQGVRRAMIYDGRPASFGFLVQLVAMITLLQILNYRVPGAHATAVLVPAGTMIQGEALGHIAITMNTKMVHDEVRQGLQRAATFCQEGCDSPVGRMAKQAVETKRAKVEASLNAADRSIVEALFDAFDHNGRRKRSILQDIGMLVFGFYTKKQLDNLSLRTDAIVKDLSATAVAVNEVARHGQAMDEALAELSSRVQHEQHDLAIVVTALALGTVLDEMAKDVDKVEEVISGIGGARAAAHFFAPQELSRAWTSLNKKAQFRGLKVPKLAITELYALPTTVHRTASGWRLTIHVPLIKSKRPLALFRLMTMPTPTAAGARRIRSVHTFIAVTTGTLEEDTEAVVLSSKEAEQCLRFSGLVWLCHQKLVTRRKPISSCIGAIQAEQSAKIAELCVAQECPDEAEAVWVPEMHQFLVYLPSGETAAVRCHSNRQHDEEVRIPAGTSWFAAKQGCTVSTTSLVLHSLEEFQAAINGSTTVPLPPVMVEEEKAIKLPAHLQVDPVVIHPNHSSKTHWPALSMAIVATVAVAVIVGVMILLVFKARPALRAAAAAAAATMTGGDQQ